MRAIDNSKQLTSVINLPLPDDLEQRGPVDLETEISLINCPFIRREQQVLAAL